MEEDISTRVDKSTASIGRRYARADEIGVPFAVTVDFETLKTDRVTLRERDSTHQISLRMDEVTKIIHDFVHGKLVWGEGDFWKVFQKVGDTKEDEENKVDEGEAVVLEKTGRGNFMRPAVSPLDKK